MNKPLSDEKLAKKLNEIAHMGGSLTEYGIWYPHDTLATCLLFPVRDNWTAYRVHKHRGKSQGHK